MEFSLLGTVVVAVAAACGALALTHRRDGAQRRRTIDLVATGLLAGIAAGRLWAMIATGTNPLTHPVDILIVRGGVDTVAATLGALAAVAWASRTDLLPMLDGVAPGAAFGLAGWHAGCLVRNACLGTPTTLPWGWSATADGPGRHPVELYTAILLVLAGWLVLRLWQRRPGTGMATAVALLAAATTRAVSEPLRPVLGDGLLVEYLVAAGASLALGVLLLWKPPATRRNRQRLSSNHLAGSG